MPTQLFSNNSETALNQQLAAGATSIVLNTGDGDNFQTPLVSQNEYEALTLIHGTNVEIIHLVQRGSPVAQVDTLTPGGTIVPATSLFQVDLTDDDDVVHSFNFLATGSTVASVVTQLYNEWTGQVGAPWDEYTVVDQTSQLQITRNTAGLPFTLASSASGGGSETLTRVTPTPHSRGGGDTLTVERAKEGTAARQWEIGQTLSARTTAGTLEKLRDEVAQALADAAAAIFTPRPTYVDLGLKNADFNLDVSQAETIRFEVSADVVVTLTGGVRGETTRICIVQDGTGGHDVDIANINRWQDGAVPPLLNLSNKMDVVGIIYMPPDGTTDEYVGMAYATNL